MSNFSKISFILLVATILNGCLSTQESTVDFTYIIKASADINPSIDNLPSPVVLRVYQLSNKINFEHSSYETLFNSDLNTLGTEYLKVSEYLIPPGTNKQEILQISKSAKYIGVAVGYRSIELVNWRIIIPTPTTKFWKSSGIAIQLDRVSVRVTSL